MNRSIFIRGVCGAALALVACTGAEASGEGKPSAATAPLGSDTARTPTQYVVILDVSGSIAPQARAAMQGYVTIVLQALSFGDRVVVMTAPSDGVANSTMPLSTNMPDLSHPGPPSFAQSQSLTQVKGYVANQVRKMLQSTPTTGTDLFAALFDAGQFVPGPESRGTTIVVLSDMLQCAAGVCFQAAAAPDSGWIERRRHSGVLPDLRGACVVVIGADASTPHGVAVRQFWERYLAATGASLDPHRYVYRVSSPDLLNCHR